MIEDNLIGGFAEGLRQEYNSLPDEIIELVESYIAVLGEPMNGDCEDGYFVEMAWDGDHDLRMLECFIYDIDTVEFIKVTLSEDEESEDYTEEKSDDTVLELKNWLDGNDY